MITLTSDALILAWPLVITLFVLGALLDLVLWIWTSRARRRVAAVQHDEIADLLGKVVDHLSDSFTTQEEIAKTLVEIRDREEN